MAFHVTGLEELGAFLKGLRVRSQLSLRALHKQTGINPGSLGKWENGLHWPEMNRLGVLLRFYGETVTFGWDPGAEEDELWQR